MSEFPKIAFGDADLTNNSFAFTVSREYALDMGMIEPTPEELAERNESARTFHASQRDIRARTLAALADLSDKGGLTQTLLDLHQCDLVADWTPECAGCDFAGCEGEPPEWPCRTVLALAEHHGIDMPNTLPGRHYEGEFIPSTGKVIEWPTPRWHFIGDSNTET